MFVVAFLWSPLALLNAASAQESTASARDQVPIRASYQGQFLPDGTELIVLSKDGRLQRQDRYQPEFLPMSDYPRHDAGPTSTDRLGDDGRSVGTYARTQSDGRLYFIYALAPDSTLYGSYSADRDSLKFDVIHSGVMSVAPITADEIRGEVLASFFSQRVTVLMPSDYMSAEPAADLGNGASGRDSFRMQDGDVQNREDAEIVQAEHDDLSRLEDGESPVVGGRGNAGEEGIVRAASDHDDFIQKQDSLAAAQNPAFPAGARMRSPANSVGPVSSAVAFSILAVLALAAAVPVFVARNYRRELKRARLEMVTLRMKATGDENVSSVRQQLNDAKRRSQQMEEKYESLLHHYLALKRERESQRA